MASCGGTCVRQAIPSQRSKSLAAILLTFPFSSDAFGDALAPLPILNRPNLVGLTLYAQALWVWTSCPLPPFGLSSSKGLALTVLVP